MTFGELKPQSRDEVLKVRRKFAEISPNGAGAAALGALPTLEFADYQLDYERGALYRAGREIPLRPKTFTCLCHFAANPGRLISKNELIETVWPDVVVTEDSIVQCVAELRRALDDQAQRIIKTLPRRGYRFDIAASAAETTAVTPTPETLAEEAEAPVIAPGFPKGRFKGFAIIGLLGLFAVAGTGWFAARAPQRALTPSLVVLPFSAEPEQVDLATGLSNDLMVDLSRYSDLLVIAPGTAGTFRGTDVDRRRISRELNVRYLLEGDVRENGELIRINVRLIDGETGQTRWAERFERERQTIPEWQDEIVGRVAVALDYRMTALASERGLRERPHNPDAFDLTARGWATVYAAKTAENYHAAVPLFRQALERDPKALSAEAGLAWSTGILLMNGWSLSAEEDRQTAQALVADLLRRDPDHVIAHHVRGFLLRYEKRTEAAREAFATAIAINPNFAPSHAQLGVSELELGRPKQAIVEAKQALRLSPRDPNLRTWLACIGMAELHLGRPSYAVNSLARATDVEAPVVNHHVYYISALMLSGRIEDAQAELRRFRAARPSATISSVRAAFRSVNADYVKQQEPLFEGLRLAGLPE